MTRMAPEERTERFGIRLSTTEVAMLDALAEATGLSASDVTRLAIRDAYRAKFGDKKPAKPKK